MSEVLTEPEAVALIVDLLINSPEISEYQDENCPFDLGDNPSNEQEDFFYAYRNNLMNRLLALAMVDLFKPGVPKRTGLQGVVDDLHQVDKTSAPWSPASVGPTWVEGKAASVQQLKMATDILERECTTAWELFSAYSDPNNVPDALAMRAHGLVNVLSDLGVEGYEMS